VSLDLRRLWSAFLRGNGGLLVLNNLCTSNEPVASATIAGLGPFLNYYIQKYRKGNAAQKIVYRKVIAYILFGLVSESHACSTD
jgi:hypothetical protein